MAALTLFVHLYYPGSWQTLEKKCSGAFRQARQIILTACHDDVLDETLSSSAGLPGMIRLKVPNKGKDIGGKLLALCYYLRCCQKTKYIGLLHDKVSPQTINASYWSDTLYSPFSDQGLRKVLDKLDNDSRIGVVGARRFLKNEFDHGKKNFETTNDSLLQELIKEYDLHCRRYDFIAGTIFVCRSAIMEEFFSRHPALEARALLEEGNVMDLQYGTYTHTWERLFCFIAEHQGYTIEGI
jgi:lipopolysaccharide biosynthesis protein